MQRASRKRRKEMFHSSSLEKATKDDFATSMSTKLVQKRDPASSVGQRQCNMS